VLLSPSLPCKYSTVQYSAEQYSTVQYSSYLELSLQYLEQVMITFLGLVRLTGALSGSGGETLTTSDVPKQVSLC